MNGRSLGERRLGDANALHLDWVVPFEAGRLRAIGQRDGQPVLVREIYTAGAAAGLTLSTDRGVLAADPTDLAFVEVGVVDAHGTLVPDAATAVQFSVEGPGRTIATDNGNPIDLTPFQSSAAQLQWQVPGRGAVHRSARPDPADGQRRGDGIL